MYLVSNLLKIIHQHGVISSLLVVTSMFSGSRVGSSNLQDDWAPDDGPLSGPPKNILFLLDCSYSMSQKTGSKPKFDTARDAVKQVLDQVPVDVHCGLRVFGHTKSELSSPQTDCRSTELICDFETSRKALKKRLDTLSLGNMSPIQYSLNKARSEELCDVKGKAVIIFLTDGADNCGGNLRAYINTTPNFRDVGIPIYVVSMASFRDRLAVSEHQAIASASGGHLFRPDEIPNLVEYLGFRFRAPMRK